MNLLIIGSLCSGKTSIAQELIKRGFCKESNYHSIEQCRRKHSDGTFSGEMFAWANFLQAIEQPALNTNNIYEFSGTGRNNWNVGEAMKYAQRKDGQDWYVVITAAPDEELIKRTKGKKYDAPCPYLMTDIPKSVAFMSKEIKEILGVKYAFAAVPRIIVRTDGCTIEEATEKILAAVNPK
jgi:hypothetical protein